MKSYGKIPIFHISINIYETKFNVKFLQMDIIGLVKKWTNLL